MEQRDRGHRRATGLGQICSATAAPNERRGFNDRSPASADDIRRNPQKFHRAAHDRPRAVTVRRSRRKRESWKRIIHSHKQCRHRAAHLVGKINGAMASIRHRF